MTGDAVLDRATLLDLGIITDTGADSALMLLLDHTRTAGGRRLFRRMLASPISDLQALPGRQADIRFLTSSTLALPTGIAVSIEQSRKYLDSGYLPLPSARVARWLTASRYPEMAATLMTGMTALQKTLTCCRSISYELDAREMDARGALIRVQTAISAALKQPEVGDFLDARDRATASFDHALRGSLKRMLLDAIDALEEYDALRSFGEASQTDGFTFPAFEENGPAFRASGAFHPLLPGGVRNDVSLDAASSVMVITGPNMAGKTTFARTCALIVLLAHTGMAVPASSARLSLFDRIVSVGTVRDDLSRGESLFLAEVRRMKALVSHLASRQRVFALIDEMFKGTNVEDAMDASIAVASGLSRYDAGLFVISTHLAGMARSLADTPQCVLANFTGSDVAERATFDYIMRPGVSTQRLGIAILRQEGLLEMLRRLS